MSVPARNYDLAFVGSGIACTMTLSELAALLLEKPARDKPLQIVVIEREAEFWKGIAYGSRSALNSLIITSLREFVDEPGREAFIDWLRANQPKWSEQLEQHGGEAGARWIKTNQHLIQNGKWDDIFLPRFVFGLYNSELLATKIAKLKQQGVAMITQVQAEVISLVPADDAGYDLTIENASGCCTPFRANRIVLAIGSPPMNPLPIGTFNLQNHPICLNDIYCPSTEANLKRIHEALAGEPEREKRNLLIVGSNASALELLYLLNHRTQTKALINSIVAISRTGSLPNMICDEKLDFEFTELQSLKQKDSVSASQLIAAIKADNERAEAQGLNKADLFHPVSAVVGDVIQRMETLEQESFFCKHGMTFTKLMRRAGREYRQAADELAAAGTLSLEQGELIELRPAAGRSGFASAAYIKPGTKEISIHPLPFLVIVNCAGFEELNASSSRLIASLIKNQVCRINKTNRGFLVNERLEANRNLFVIGPLIGGNFNNKIRFWHAESAPRINGLAKMLAAGLWDSFSHSNPCPGKPATDFQKAPPERAATHFEVEANN